MAKSRTITILVPVLLLIYSGIGTVHAQNEEGESDITVSFVNGSQITADPGGITTIAFRITSSKPNERTVDPFFELPDGWQIVGETRPLTMASPGSLVGFVSLRVPKTVTAGSYLVRLGVRDSMRPDEQASVDATVFVSSTFGVGLSVSSPAEYVRAGTDLLAAITVSNRGNADVRVHLVSKTLPDADARLDSSLVHLGPMESRRILLKMSTNANLTRETVYQTYVQASTDDTPASFESVVLRIHVIPSFDHSGKGIGTQPVYLSLQSVGDERTNGSQVGVSGAFEAFGGNVDINMLVANQQRVSMFGSRDIYRVMYASDQFELQLGDQLQKLSPLTTTGEYGAGLGASINTGKVFFRGFAQRSRFMYPEQSLFGGSIGARPGKGLTMSLNALKRVGSYEGTVLTARTELTPFGPNHTMDLECGLDSSAGFEKPSCSAVVGGRFNGLTYQGRLLRTTDSFPGPRGHTNEESARLTYRLPMGLSVEGAIRRQAWSIQEDFNRTVSHDQIGIGYEAGNRTIRMYSRLYYLNRMWAYDSPGYTVDRSEDLMRLQLGFHTLPFDLNGTVDIGSSESISNGNAGPSRRYQLTARFVPIDKLSISATGERGSGYLTASAQKTRIWMLNIQAAYRFTQNTGLSATVYRNVTESTVRQPYDSFKAQAQHTFKFGHLLTLQFQYSALSGSRSIKSTDYRIAYSIPVGVPIGRKQASATLVRGRIYDAETGTGLNGILLFLGNNTTMSDETGRFVIPKPSGRSSYLRIDQRSLGYDSVPMIPMPYEIQAGDDQSNVLEIPVMRAASVRGTVLQYGPKSGEPLLGDLNANLERLAGVGSVIIGLSSGTAEYRARTDPSGRFEFQNVVPDDYLVRVITPLRIANHRFEPDSLQITLSGGSSTMIEFRVVPERREIRMLPQIEPIKEIQEREIEGTPSTILMKTPVLEPTGGSTTATATSVKWSLNPQFRYTLIVFSSFSESSATQALSRFGKTGLPLRVLKSYDGQNGLFLAAIGQFRSSDEANRIREKLSAVIPEDAWVYPYIR